MSEVKGLSETEILQIVDERRPNLRNVWRRVELFFADPDPYTKRVRPHCIILDVPHWGVPDAAKDIIHKQLDRAQGEYLGCVSFDLPTVGQPIGEQQ